MSLRASITASHAVNTNTARADSENTRTKSKTVALQRLNGSSSTSEPPKKIRIVSRRRQCTLSENTAPSNSNCPSSSENKKSRKSNKKAVVAYGTTELKDLKEQHKSFAKSNIMKVSVFVNTEYGIQGGGSCDEKGSECSKMETFESCPMTSKCINLLKIRKLKVTVGASKVAGKGVFAREFIKKKTVIMIYIGEIITNDEYEKRKKVYKEMGIDGIYGYENGSGYTTDATLYGNLARYVNHSCEPNVEVDKWTVAEYPLGYSTVVFTAKEDIAEGQELFVNYNFDYHSEKSIRCFCKAPTCTNFLGKGPPGGNQKLSPPSPPSPPSPSSPPLPSSHVPLPSPATLSEELVKKYGSIGQHRVRDEARQLSLHADKPLRNIYREIYATLK